MNFDIPLNEIFIALPAVQFVVSVFLAILVIFSDPRNRLNRLFAVFLLGMAAWGITIFGMREPPKPHSGTEITGSSPCEL